MPSTGESTLRRRLAHRPARWALAAWLLFLLACAAVISGTRFTADLSAFLPRAPTAEQQLLVDQLRDGLVSRLILVGIEGGDAPGRAAVSRAMAASLGNDGQFAAIHNGEPVTRQQDQQFLYAHRYALSPGVTPQRFTEAGLRAALGESLDLLASPAGLFTKALLPRDPTGEVAALVGQLDAGAGVAVRDGAWISRDGARAVLLAQTAAPGADTDAQARAMAALRDGFQAAVNTAAPAAEPYRLVMSGPGVISVNTRDTIKREVERIALVSTAVIVGLLWFAYRSVPALLLGLLPVASGVLAGITAVSLGFGTVHGLTLGFGTTLIGESVDYAIYLFAQASGRAGGEDDTEAARPRWMAGFWPTVRLGVLTSICGFASLLLSGFPGLAQLGLFSIAGLASAALVTRFVLPHLVPAGFRMRDVRPLGERAARLARHARRLRWPLAVLLVAACVVLFGQRERLWSRELASLSPVPASVQALDTALRADVGAPDVRYLVVVSGPDQETVLQGAERIGERLRPLVENGTIAGFESPARYLPSEATQRARLASLPPREVLAERLRTAIDGMPVKPALFAPFLDEVETARNAAPLRREHLRGTSMALAVDALLTHDGERWSATLPLRAPASSPRAEGLDTSAIRATIAQAGVRNALFVDLKGESDRLYAGYLREAMHLSLGGVAAIAVLLLVVLRSPRRVVATMLPLAAAALLVTAGLALGDRQLSLLHLVGLLLLVAVGSNYALFFNGAAQRGTSSGAPGLAPNTMASLLLANATTVAAFGLLGFSTLPLLQAIGLTVGPGAVLALLFSAMFAPAAMLAPPAPARASHGSDKEKTR
jgi:predicted exporter